MSRSRFSSNYLKTGMKKIKSFITTKWDFTVLSQVSEISLRVREFYRPLIFLLEVNSFINGK